MSAGFSSFSSCLGVPLQLEFLQIPEDTPVSRSHYLQDSDSYPLYSVLIEDNQLQSDRKSRFLLHIVHRWDLQKGSILEE